MGPTPARWKRDHQPRKPQMTAPSVTDSIGKAAFIGTVLQLAPLLAPHTAVLDAQTAANGPGIVAKLPAIAPKTAYIVAQPPRITVADFAWLAGSWEGRMAD